MTKYLYGASIQGIQSFIFQTNKLKEIVGGSELVEEICTEMFYKFINSDKLDENIILSAAGNIKYIADEETCKKLVKGFPMEIMNKAPGVTVSQSIIKLNESVPLSDSISLLEEKLKAERNKPNMPLEVGYMGLERARRTGGVAVDFKKNRKGNLEAFCESTLKKAEFLNKNLQGESKHTTLFRKVSGLTENPKEITLEIEEICKGHKNSWIAVVHADGNGLGNIIRVMGEKLKGIKTEESKAAFRQFSQALENATQTAVQSAFWTVYSKSEAFNSDNNHTIRPIICGGDDISIIIRADLALEFTEVFLKEFEAKTKEEFKVLEKYNIDDFKEGITACAGIAYIKESYPLHYALNLSESLCNDAKKLVKGHHLRPNGIPESSIAFYKMQESFTDKISVLKERTLLASQQGKTLDYYYGPYLISDIKDLQKKLSELSKEADDSQEGSKAIGKIRSIVSDSFKDFSVALFNLQRMKTINKDFFSRLQLQNDLDTLTLLTKEDSEQIAAKSQLLDLITLHGFRYGTRHN